MLKRVLLFPLTFLYYCITAFRNFLYDYKILDSKSYSFPVICVGNLKVGGTGKTPHVEYLTNLLSTEYKTAILSRGYGRKSKGFLEVLHSSEVTQAGDEPSQYKKKYDAAVNVFVCEDRQLGINTIKNKYPQTDVIILDDAFQHRRVQAGLNILLTEFAKPFFSDFVMPGGWLRESRYGAERADVILVSKCPDEISKLAKLKFVEKITKYTGNKPVFFTKYKYGTIRPVYSKKNITEKISHSTPVLALTGIANAHLFLSYLNRHYTQVSQLELKDHHQYTQDDENFISGKLKALNSKQTAIITTEKDAVKIKDLGILKNYPLYYIPIEVVFLEKEEEFRTLVRNFVTKND